MTSLKLKCLSLLFPGDFSQSDSRPLHTQTSGKRTFQRSKNGREILKPYPKRKQLMEEKFYLWVNDKSRVKPKIDIKDFVPGFYGTQVSDHFTFLVLDNITWSYKCPSVADIKIGAQTWMPSDCNFKIAKECRLYPLGRSLGFRVTGVNMYLPSVNKYKKIPFWRIRGLSEDELRRKVFVPFFSTEQGKIRMMVVYEIIRKLLYIKEWFLRHNDRFHFYSSSILIVYETSTSETCKVDVRMIDFAHVVDIHKDQHHRQSCCSQESISESTSDYGSSSSCGSSAAASLSTTSAVDKNEKFLDENYLHGLNNFTSFLEMLLPSC